MLRAELVDENRLRGGLLPRRSAARCRRDCRVPAASNHPEEMSQMRQHARWEYEEKYTPERNYELLMDIYRQTLSKSKVEKWESAALVS